MKTKLAKQIFVFFIFIITVFIACNSVGNAASNANYYLSKPTGQYGVGFEDFHWINQNVCPDFNFNGKNLDDFSKDNPNFCHEVMVRVYYPTSVQSRSGAPYNQSFIKQNQEIFRQIPSIPKDQIDELSQLRSFSTEKASLVSSKNFPVILFSPGFGCPAELYENFITELVSQGYIVVGINTPFINLVSLPNGHIRGSVEESTKVAGL